MRQESELRPYQDRIATYLYDHDEALCVVRPGYGKTISALTAIRELKRDGVIRMALVVAPKRVANSVWPDEIAEWAHVAGLRYALLTGTRKERSDEFDYAFIAKMDLVIVGVDNIAWLIEEKLAHLPVEHPIFDLLVIDEISKLRNPTGVRAKLLAKHGKWWKMRWGLSGTLRPNSAQDFFMPVRVVTQGKVWGKSFYQWRKENFYTTDFHGYNWAPLPGREAVISAEVADLSVTLRPEETLQLPQLSVQFDYVELPEPAREAYTTMHKKLVARLHDKGKDVVAANAAVATGKLAQLANGFVYHDDEDSNVTEAEAIHDEKYNWLLDVIEEATGPTLLVYEYQHDLKVLREILGDDFRYLGAGVSDKLAALNIAEWNAGKLPFMGLHPASGGHGLNLQHGGCDMAWIGPTWSPELWEQTIARLHRSGQTRPVIVRVCVARDTVDQLKLDRVHFKMSQQEAFEKYLKAQQDA